MDSQMKDRLIHALVKFEKKIGNNNIFSRF